MNRFYTLNNQNDLSIKKMVILKIAPYLCFPILWGILSWLTRHAFLSLALSIGIFYSVKVLVRLLKKKNALNHRDETTQVIDDFVEFMNSEARVAYFTNEDRVLFGTLSSAANMHAFYLTSRGIKYLNKLMEQTRNLDTLSRRINRFNGLGDYCNDFSNMIEEFNNLTCHLHLVHDQSCAYPVAYDHALFERVDPESITQEELELTEGKLNAIRDNMYDFTGLIVLHFVRKHALVRKDIRIFDPLYEHFSEFKTVNNIYRKHTPFIYDSELTEKHKIARVLVLSDLETVCRNEVWSEIWYKVYQGMREKEIDNDQNMEM